MLAYFVVRRWSKTFRGRHEDVDTRVCHSCLLTLLCEVGVRHLEEDMKMLTQEYVIHACLLCCATLE